MKLQKNWLEWLVFSLSFVLVLCTLGYLVYDGATSAKTPANISLELGKPQPQAEFFKIPVSVTNSGDTTAETVLIEVKLENAGIEKESAQFEIGFLPRHSQREGWVTFQTDPRTVEELSAKVLGFEQP